MHKKISIIITLMSFINCGYAFVVWPNASAPCNSSLQACIDSSAVGEYIEVQSDGPINEDISTTTALSLVAGIGYKPVFSSGNRIQMNLTAAGALRTVQIKGFTFESGGIRVSTLGAPINFIIEGNTVEATSLNIPAIEVISASVQATDVQIRLNNVFAETSGATAFAYGAILVNKNGIGVGSITGEIFNNTIRSVGINSKGVSVFASNNSDIDMNIAGNVIYGGTSGGIYINRFNSSTASSDFDIVSNAFYQEGTFFNPSGIYIINDTGTTTADIINNSLIDSREAVYLRNGVGSLNVNAQNNLIAYAGIAFDSQASVSLTNDYNLFYQNTSASIEYIAGAHDLNTNPMIMHFKNARLHASSPAIEAGNSLALLLVADAPFIDADGLLRLKNATATGSGIVDIGAYEAGDLSFIHQNSNTVASHISIIDNPLLNDLSALDDLQITSNWNPNETAGIYNNENEALYYAGGFWRVFNEGFNDLMESVSFNISKMASNSNTFEHLVTGAGENNTMINQVGLDNHPEYILQVSQHWTNIYNPHPPGIFYFETKWFIINLDAEVMPTNSNFNVYYQERSKSAFIHTAKAPNTSGNVTVLDNALINGVSCAQIQVTQSSGQSIFNASPVGVFYSAGEWAIFNQNLTTMPLNAVFHVLINPAQIAQCTDVIFKDGFE
jgi:hypothetical protein